MRTQIKGIKVAVEGCCHGELNNIYKSLMASASRSSSEPSSSSPVDLLIICGDFQAIRNHTDLDTMNVPPKFKHIRDFHEYYSGKKTAPVLTLFIGGNHECSSYLQELEYGGWVAPNIYYLGAAGAVWYRGLKICGISGIYNQFSFQRNYTGKRQELELPYSDSTIRSSYHVKPKNFMKTALQDANTDIVISHDWPQYIWEYGHKHGLLKRKHFFKTDMASGDLGSPVNKVLLHALRPNFWFSSHLHAKFEANVSFSDGKPKRGKLKLNQYLNFDRVHGDFSVSGMKHQSEFTTESEANRPSNAGTDANFNMQAPNFNKEELVVDMDSPGTNIEEISIDMDSPVTEKNDTNPSVGNKEEISIDMDSPVSNKEEISIDMDSPAKNNKETNRNQQPTSTNSSNKDIAANNSRGSSKQHLKSPHKETYFLALDKCLPKRKFLQTMEIQPRQTNHPSLGSNSQDLYYDARAIAANKVIEKYIIEHPQEWKSLNAASLLRSDSETEPFFTELRELIDYEESKINLHDTKIPLNFMPIAPTSDVDGSKIPLRYWESNQTKEYCEKFGVPFHQLEG